MNRIPAVLLVVAFSVVGVIVLESRKKFPANESLLVASPRFPPFSSDPLDYDAMVHHITFSSVYSPLVTNYKLGEMKGIIAESWTHNDDFSEWNFKIRTGLRFSNQEAISPLAVYKSFVRVAYKMKVSKSESGIVEFLQGISDLSSANGKVSGISLVGDTLTLRFTKPIPRLITLISFGLYAIVAPSTYDPQTGDWIDSKAVVSSGAYQIENWSTHGVSLKLRKDYPAILRHELAYPHIEILPYDSPRLQNTPHITIGFSDQVLGSESTTFIGPVESVIRHIRCYHWQDPKHPFFSKEMRQKFRDQIYGEMEQRGQPITRSFLPPQLNGIQQFPSTPVSSPLKFDKDILLPSGIQIHDSQSTKLPVQEAFLSSLQKIAELSHRKIQFVEETAPLTPDTSKSDLRLMLTDILIDSPIDDLRFMLLSAHGLKLPDPTGKLKKLVQVRDVDIQSLNAQLWEDAVIWPISHVAFGFWYDKNSNHDFSQYNAAIGPVDFRWIGTTN